MADGPRAVEPVPHAQPALGLSTLLLRMQRSAAVPEARRPNKREVCAYGGARLAASAGVPGLRVCASLLSFIGSKC